MCCKRLLRTVCLCVMQLLQGMEKNCLSRWRLHKREKCQGPAGPVPDELAVLMTAYKNAKTRNMKRQILSLYAYRYPMNMLKKIHESYGKLSTWEIKQARSHANLQGPGTIPENTTKHRIRLDTAKVDHFVEFVNRPYFYQDVSFGSKILTLDNGDRIEMPHVVRTVTRSTMIDQYLEYCKEQCHEPLRPCFVWSRVPETTLPPSYPGRANFSLISLKNSTDCLHENANSSRGGRDNSGVLEGTAVTTRNSI